MQTITVKQPANLGIIVPEKSFELTSSANTLEVEVLANVQYSLTLSDSWIKQIGTKGLATNKLIFSIEENRSFENRNATIRITPTAPAIGVQELVISVNQAGREDMIAVDLGLSVKWANMNLDALTPEGSGDYYAWGEVDTKSSFTWGSYKWSNDTQTYFEAYITKYNSSPDGGIVDNKVFLDPTDDVVATRYGNGWRLPTKDEMLELIDRNNSEISWSELNGKHGLKIVSKINGNKIFIPALGYKQEDKSILVEECGAYWTSTRAEGSSLSAYNLHFSWDGSFMVAMTARCEGLQIRPVKE